MMFVFVALTVVATVLFVSGCVSFRRLVREFPGDWKEQGDPLTTSISLLFSTDQDDARFRRRQRLTIWLFCGAALLLIAARAALP